MFTKPQIILVVREQVARPGDASLEVALPVDARPKIHWTRPEQVNSVSERLRGVRQLAAIAFDLPPPNAASGYPQCVASDDHWQASRWDALEAVDGLADRYRVRAAPSQSRTRSAFCRQVCCRWAASR